MKTMYKDGEECTANDDQVDLMKSAGWSLDKPKKTSPEENTEQESTPKRAPKRKPIKKSETEE